MLNSTRTPAPPHVLIVGGGLAGLAAASALVGRGVRISLIESRPRLGGRASSFNDPVTGESVDNCQHVSMACCTNLADFCRRVKIDELFRREESIVFLSPEGRTSKLRTGLLPAPFHLAGSFLRANYLRWSEKLRVAYGLACLRSPRDDRPGESFADWLLRHGQTIRTINLYWATVLVSAAQRAARADGCGARAQGLHRRLPAEPRRLPDGDPLVPLGELYGSRLENWLREHDVAVRLTTGVRSVKMDDEGEIRGVTLRSGESIEADFVILAVPFDRVQGFLPDEVQAEVPALASVDVLQASPITGVHLWFDRPVCPSRMW